MREESARRLFAGIDGGQTSTIALISDEDGTVLGRGTAGPCDEIGEPSGSRRLADALEGAVAAAMHDAGLEPDTELECVVAGLSGFEGELIGQAPRLPTRRLELMHDAPVALAGALDGPGIVLISGTGSVAYGKDPGGRTARGGGWGYLFGDRGSAFWIAREALSEAMRMSDFGVTNTLAERALGYFGRRDLRVLARDVYSGKISRLQLAQFASLVAAAAEEGDPAADLIIDQGAIALSRLVRCVRQALDFPSHVRVALCGGALVDGPLRAATERVLRADAELEPVAPLAEPAVGALRLAIALAPR